MGFCKFVDLIGLTAPDSSHPIGVEERRLKLTATLSEINDDGEIVFVDERSIEREFGWLQLPGEEDGESRVWMGFEVQTQDPALRDATLVIATHPYSTDWFDWADFKPVRKRSVDELLRPLMGASAVEVSELMRSREKLAWDPKETRSGGWLTARLSLPTRTEDLGITGHTRGAPQVTWTAVRASLNRRWHRKDSYGLWCFGACREFEKCRQFLRISQQAMDLMDSTVDGTLFESNRATGRAPEKNVADTAKALRKPILEGAIIKALAGPAVEDAIPGNKPRLVARSMKSIYTETMLNLVKRLEEPGVGGVELYFDGSGVTQPTALADELAFDKQVESARRHFQDGDHNPAFRALVEQALAREDTGTRIAAIAVIAGAHQAGIRGQRTFIEKFQEIATDAEKSDALRYAAGQGLAILRRDAPPEY